MASPLVFSMRSYLFLLCCFVPVLAVAQSGSDSNWKVFCDSLIENSKAIENGQMPADLKTANLPAGRAEAMARGNSDRGKHELACFLFGSAAVQRETVGSPNLQLARQDVYLAHTEQKLANGAKLSFTEKMSRASDRLTVGTAGISYDEYQPAAATGNSSPVSAAGLAPQSAPRSGTQAANNRYTPLPNDSPSPTGSARYDWVVQHSTAAGTPAACTVNWVNSGPLSNACADALFAQAQSERAGGNCTAAMTDYDNARQAAQNGGTIVMMGVRETDGRTECLNKLNPPKPEPGVTWGEAGVMPVGRYTCYSAPAVIANGGAYGTTAVQIGQWQGYVWIFDDHRYAAPYSDKDAGTYRMSGNNMIAIDGPYGPKRNKTQ